MDIPVKDLETVLEYLWRGELDYYLECAPDEKHRSVFHYALVVSAWLACEGRSDIHRRMVASLRPREAAVA